MNITIIGIGAMGCLFGAYLSRQANVTLLGHWPEQVEALRQNGLRLIDTSGQAAQFQLNVTTKPSGSPPADLVLVLVKSYQTAAAATVANQCLRPDGLAVTLQNGLNNGATLTAVLGPRRVAVGSTAQGATLIEPGVVGHAGHGLTQLAQNAETAVRLQQLAALLQQAGLETHLIDSGDSLIWGKLAVNAAINPLGALLNVPNGYLLTNRTARKYLVAAAQEVAAVAGALGISLPYPDAARRAIEVATATASNYSSMCQDVQHGRPTEVEAICGSVVQYGEQLGIATPVNKRLLALIRGLHPPQKK
jgi:2-dehydropantoate 2-reductase